MRQYEAGLTLRLASAPPRQTARSATNKAMRAICVKLRGAKAQCSGSERACDSFLDDPLYPGQEQKPGYLRIYSGVYISSPRSKLALAFHLAAPSCRRPCASCAGRSDCAGPSVTPDCKLHRARSSASVSRAVAQQVRGQTSAPAAAAPRVLAFELRRASAAASDVGRMTASSPPAAARLCALKAWRYEAAG